MEDSYQSVGSYTPSWVNLCGVARKENSRWPCLSHVVLCVVRECGQLGLNQKSKVLLEEEGDPVGQTEDVSSTALGGASLGLPPALVCLGILAPHSTHLQLHIL